MSTLLSLFYHKFLTKAIGYSEKIGFCKKVLAKMQNFRPLPCFTAIPAALDPRFYDIALHNLQEDFNNQLRLGKTTFLPKRTCRILTAFAERVNLRHFVICVPFYGVPKNRNKQSEVRFWGKRSNKYTRAWRKATRAVCHLSPYCDVAQREKIPPFGLRRRRGVFLFAENRRRQLAEIFASFFNTPSQTAPRALPFCRNRRTCRRVRPRRARARGRPAGP